MAVADLLETLENWLPVDNFHNTEWIQRQWIEMFLKKSETETREMRRKGRRGNKWPATDLGERASTNARSNRPKLPNSMIRVLILRVSNGKDMDLAPKQLEALHTDVMHWEELIDSINKIRGPKEPYILTSILKCTLEQDKMG